MKFRDKSPAAKAICEPRWEGWTDKSRHDPCGGCPLYVPCIKQSPGPGREAFNRWIDGINAAAEVA